MKTSFRVWFRQKLPDKLKRRGNKCNCVADGGVCVNPRGCASRTPLAFELLVGDDLDAEARQALVVVHRRGEMADRGDAEIAQDLGTDADLAPLPVAVGL